MTLGAWARQHALELASHPLLFNHSRRTYRFGMSLGVVTGTEVDEELLYAAAMLHDTGLLASSGDADGR